jgi:hypothetical protein
LLLDVLEYRIEVIIENRRVGVSYTPNLIHDRIVHGLASKSSSGVQMIGAFRPFSAQTFSIKGRILAFAK